MKGFTLVDLESQYFEVVKQTRGKTKNQILEWLRQFGEVKHLSNPYDDDLYGIHTPIGIRTGFRLTEDGNIILIGHHTTLSENPL